MEATLSLYSCLEGSILVEVDRLSDNYSMIVVNHSEGEVQERDGYIHLIRYF